MSQVDIRASQNLFCTNFREMAVFFEIFAGWKRIPNAWKPGNWEFTVYNNVTFLLVSVSFLFPTVHLIQNTQRYCDMY